MGKLLMELVSLILGEFTFFLSKDGSVKPRGNKSLCRDVIELWDE